MSNKSERIGMRIDPSKKDKWLTVSKTWGYNGLTTFIESMVDWAIVYEEYNGDYNAYLADKSKQGVA